MAVRPGRNARFCPGQRQRVPVRVGRHAILVAHPADCRIGPLENHRLRAVLFQDIAHVGNRAAIEPDLEHHAIPAQEFRELLSEDLVVALLGLGRFAAPAAAGPELVVGRAEIDPQLDSPLAARFGQILHHVALAAAPRDVPDAVIGGFCLPPAEPTGVLGHEDDVLRAHRLGSGNPLVGVELLGIDHLQGHALIVILPILPRAGVETYKHADLAIVPGCLLWRGSDQFLGRRLGGDAESGGEKTGQ